MKIGKSSSEASGKQGLLEGSSLKMKTKRKHSRPPQHITSPMGFDSLLPFTSSVIKRQCWRSNLFELVKNYSLPLLQRNQEKTIHLSEAGRIVQLEIQDLVSNPCTNGSTNERSENVGPVVSHSSGTPSSHKQDKPSTQISRRIEWRSLFPPNGQTTKQQTI
jgi:hypothetical protein